MECPILSPHEEMAAIRKEVTNIRARHDDIVDQIAEILFRAPPDEKEEYTLDSLRGAWMFYSNALSTREVRMRHLMANQLPTPDFITV